jgi:MFS family permease
MILPSLSEGTNIALKTSDLITMTDSHTRAMWFFGLSVAFRILQGIASASIQICGYSFATNELALEKEKYIGFVEMALGLGDMFGPAMAGLFYEFLGFSGTFAFFGGMIALGTILSILWIPEGLNSITSKDKAIVSSEERLIC